MFVFDLKTVIFNIFLYLNNRDSLAFALTCRKIRDVFESDYLWKTKPLESELQDKLLSDIKLEFQGNLKSLTYKQQHKLYKQIKDIQQVYPYDLSRILYSSVLDFTENNLKQLPDLSCLTNLESIDCYNNKLCRFPDLFDFKNGIGLTNLKKYIVII